MLNSKYVRPFFIIYNIFIKLRICCTYSMLSYIEPQSSFENYNSISQLYARKYSQSIVYEKLSN